MPSTAATSRSTAALPDRRNSLRLDVLDRLDGQVVMCNIPIRLRDISAGGVATESAMPFPIGSRHLLRLTTPGGVEVMVTGTVIHQRPAWPPMGGQQFVTGFAFVDDRMHKIGDRIQMLLDAVTVELES